MLSEHNFQYPMPLKILFTFSPTDHPLCLLSVSLTVFHLSNSASLHVWSRLPSITFCTYTHPSKHFVCILLKSMFLTDLFTFGWLGPHIFIFVFLLFVRESKKQLMDKCLFDINSDFGLWLFYVHDDSIFLSVIINLYLNTAEYIRKAPKGWLVFWCFIFSMSFLN